MHISDGVLHPAVAAAGYILAGGLSLWGIRKIRDEDYPRVGIMTAAFFVASLINMKVGPTSVHLVLSSVVGVALGAMCFPAIAIGLLLQALLLQHGGITTVGVNTLVLGVPAWLGGELLRWGLARQSGGLVPYIITALFLGLSLPVMAIELLRRFSFLREAPAIVIVAGSCAIIVTALWILDQEARGGRVFRWGFACGSLAMLGSALLLFMVLGFLPLTSQAAREAYQSIAYIAFIAHAPVFIIEGLLTAVIVRYLRAAAPDLLRPEGGLNNMTEDAARAM